MAKFRATNGDATYPSFTFAGARTSGMYNSGSDSSPYIGFAISGTKVYEITSTGLSLTGGALNFASHSPGTGTAGTMMTTGSTWISYSTAGQCALKLLCANAATSGDFATVRMRARSDAAGDTVCGNFSASGGANNHGNLFAVQGYAQPNAYTNSGASNIVCGLYSCIDATAASSGRRWSTWVDTHETTKASASDYLMRLSHNGTIANDGVFTIYNGGRCPVLFNFEDAAGFLTETGDAGSTKAGYLAVTTPAGTKYIQLITA